MARAGLSKVPSAAQEIHAGVNQNGRIGDESFFTMCRIIFFLLLGLTLRFFHFPFFPQELYSLMFSLDWLKNKAQVMGSAHLINDYVEHGDLLDKEVRPVSITVCYNESRRCVG